ncbi:MAG: hypothetical protein H7174_01765 [Flavobacterium sp.]|nr:hypothetical protein [Flavobacterium sp.]
MKNLFILILFSFCFLGTSNAQVGINTTTPISTLDINGNLNVREIGILNSKVNGSGVLNGGPSGSATPISDGVYISLTPTAGNQEFIVPNAVNFPGRIYILRNISASVNAILYSFGGKFFAKDSKNPTPLASTSTITLPSDGSFKTIIAISDGENWTYFF